MAAILFASPLGAATPGDPPASTGLVVSEGAALALPLNCRDALWRTRHPGWATGVFDARSGVVVRMTPERLYDLIGPQSVIRFLLDNGIEYRGRILRIEAIPGRPDFTATLLVQPMDRSNRSVEYPAETITLPSWRVLSIAPLRNSSVPMLGQEGWFPNPEGPFSYSSPAGASIRADVLAHNWARRVIAEVTVYDSLKDPANPDSLVHSNSREAIARFYYLNSLGHLYTGLYPHWETRAAQRGLRDSIYRDRLPPGVMLTNGNLPAPGWQFLVGPHGLPNLFFNKLDHLADELVNRLAAADERAAHQVKIKIIRDAYHLALWAGDLILLIHEGIDTNSSVRFDVMNYVVARVMHGIGLPTAPALTRFGYATLQNIEVVHRDRGGSRRVRPFFSADYKALLIRWTLSRLEGYARAHGERYPFNYVPESGALPDLRLAVVQGHPGISVSREPYEAALRTQANWLAEQISLANLDEITSDSFYNQVATVWMQVLHRRNHVDYPAEDSEQRP